MKKIVFGFVLGFVAFVGVEIKAAMDVNELASAQATVGYVAVSTSTATDMSTGTVVQSPVGYNLCNDSASDAIRCGYSTSVSTIAANANLGFKVPPGECRYRGVGRTIKIYCKSESVSTATSITREAYR